MLKVGYQGVSGAFSDAALKKYFDGEECEEVSYSDFPEMFEDVESGKLDYGIFPVENTTTGVIARTFDLFQFHRVYAVGEVVIPIRECLIVNPGTRFADLSMTAEN